MTILVTTGYFTTKKYVKKILDSNVDSIIKMLSKVNNQNKKNNMNFYLGKPYDIIEVPTIDKVEVDGSHIYIPNIKKYDKWYKDELIRVFSERLNYNYNIFEEVKICPTLKIRSMKTSWGVYNKVKHTITLNSKLLCYDIAEIEYVSIHELSHVVHFNHSKDFWKLVEKYCPNYKNSKKKLKE
jgi:predicted metal-dependent hydrolase